MKAKKPKKSKSSKRLEAFKRTQEINDMVERATIENEVLNSSEDMPVEESHVTDLLDEEDKRQKASKSGKKSKK